MLAQHVAEIVALDNEMARAVVMELHYPSERALGHALADEVPAWVSKYWAAVQEMDGPPIRIRCHYSGLRACRQKRRLLSLPATAE